MSIKNRLIESLKDQKMIFGDFLFEKKEIKINVKKSEPVEENLNSKIEFMAKSKKEEIKIKQEFKPVNQEFLKATNLNELESLISGCLSCELGKTRNKFVFGTGNPNSDVMLIGEAPGADEDAQGLPFVGRAGKLLTDILKAINIEREEVFIANILKCRPPNNRDPQSTEMQTCMPYLYKQIELINPKVILCLGRIAACGLLGETESLTKMRGNVYEVKGVKMMVTYHPAALLRNPNWKKGCWEDVQQFQKLYLELKSK